MECDSIDYRRYLVALQELSTKQLRWVSRSAVSEPLSQGEISLWTSQMSASIGLMRENGVYRMLFNFKIIRNMLCVL